MLETSTSNSRKFSGFRRFCFIFLILFDFISFLYSQVIVFVWGAEADASVPARVVVVEVGRGREGRGACASSSHHFASLRGGEP